MPAGREDFPVARVAALARLQVSPAESALFQTQLTQVLAFVARVAEAALDVPAPDDGAKRALRERPDVVGESLAAEAALANAPDAIDDPHLVRVPKVLG